MGKRSLITYDDHLKQWKQLPLHIHSETERWNTYKLYLVFLQGESGGITGPPGLPGPKGEIGPPGKSLPGEPVSRVFFLIKISLISVFVTFLCVSDIIL